TRLQGDWSSDVCSSDLSTHEAQEAVGYQIALQIKEYLKHGVFQNAVNVPSVSHDEYLVMEPYIVLAERLGAFLAQASDGNVEERSEERRVGKEWRCRSA